MTSFLHLSDFRAGYIAILFVLGVIFFVPAHASAAVIFEDDFESANFNKWHESGSAQIVHSGCHQGTYCTLFDFDLPYGIFYNVLDESIDQVYLSFWIKFSPSFTFNYPFQGGGHLVRFYEITDMSGPYFGAQMDTGWGPDWWDAHSYTFSFFTRDGEDDFSFWVPQPFVPDTWQHYELFMKLNTPGTADGVLQFWLDDEQLLNEQDVVLRDGGRQDVRFDSLAFTNYDHVLAAEDPYYYIDDVQLLTDRPGTSTPDTPPADPTPESSPDASLLPDLSEADPTAIIIDATYSFFAYPTHLRQGYHIAAGNVLGDSKAEIIAGTASGLAPQVRVFDNQGNVKAQFFAYDSSLRNGVTVTACDIDGDGTDEIVTGQGRGGWPLVKIFDGYGTVINNGFFVLDGKFTGGVNVACGDTNGDGISEIVVAAMRGGGPQVMVYNEDGRILTNFMAYDPGFRGGINVSTADADGDGKDEIITGPQWGAPHVQIFQIRPNELKRLSPGFFAFNREYRGGVSVAGVDTDGDGTKEIVVAPGTQSQPQIRVYDIRERLSRSFYSYSGTFLGGVMLGGGDVDADGIGELVVIPRSAGAPHVRVIEW